MSTTEHQTIAPQAKTGDINDDPYFRRLLSLAYKNAAIGAELAECVNAWHQRQLDRYRRAPPGIGLDNPRLLELGKRAGITGTDEQIIAYGRSVLGAASHPSQLLVAAMAAMNLEGGT